MFWYNWNQGEVLTFYRHPDYKIMKISLFSKRYLELHGILSTFATGIMFVAVVDFI